MRKTIGYLKKDEKKAPADYRKLRQEVRLKSSKKIINGIIRDEQRHKRRLDKIEKMEIKKRR